jgi:hypothetical protein
MKETTHRLTVCLELGVGMIEGKRPEELVTAVEEYLGHLLAIANEERRGRLPDSSGKRDIAELTELPQVKGVIVRGSDGTALVQTGTAIKED